MKTYIIKDSYGSIHNIECSLVEQKDGYVNFLQEIQIPSEHRIVRLGYMTVAMFFRPISVRLKRETEQQETK